VRRMVMKTVLLWTEGIVIVDSDGYETEDEFE